MKLIKRIKFERHFRTFSAFATVETRKGETYTLASGGSFSGTIDKNLACLQEALERDWGIGSTAEVFIPAFSDSYSVRIKGAKGEICTYLLTPEMWDSLGTLDRYIINTTNLLDDAHKITTAIF